MFDWWRSGGNLEWFGLSEGTSLVSKEDGDALMTQYYQRFLQENDTISEFRLQTEHHPFDTKRIQTDIENDSVKLLQPDHVE